MPDVLARAGQAPARGSPAFRPDVEGLRAVAVGLVLWFHAGLAGLPGGFAGVDVFFVISGFLITGLLVREVEATGRVSLPRFYARRARRILPAAGLVLGATTLLTWAALPVTRWRDAGGDVAAAAGYVVNWRFASRAVDYLAEDATPSPVQHFWSLAVEEQYYLLWPALLLLLAVLVRRRSLPVRPVVAGGLLLVVVPSLAWSVEATSREPAAAYFTTTTRLWELGVGALVAVGAGLWPRMPRPLAAGVGWAGLATVVVGAALQTTSTPWPGLAALVPTLGTAAVVVGGFAAGPAGPVAVLGSRPMVWVGGLSYSLYLWHWPLLVAATARFGDLGPGRGLLVVLVALIPAWLTSRYVENPLRRSRALGRSPRLALSVGANVSLAGVACGLALVLGALSTVPDAPTQARGGAALGRGASPTVGTLSPRSATPSGPVTPDPLRATEDVPRAYRDGCQGGVEDDAVTSCRYGPGARGRGDTVALVGDSKVLQWLPAFLRLGRSRGWEVVTYTKSACAWAAATVVTDGQAYASCTTWSRSVLDRLTGPDRPDLVVTSSVHGSALDGGGRQATSALVTGYARYWRALGDAGVPVLALSDSPNPGSRVYECVAGHRDDYARACTYPYHRSPGTDALAEAARRVPSARLADLDPWVCPGEDRCPPVVGGVLVNRQGSHVTATYAASLAPVVGRVVSRSLAGAVEPTSS